MKADLHVRLIFTSYCFLHKSLFSLIVLEKGIPNTKDIVGTHEQLSQEEVSDLY